MGQTVTKDTVIGYVGGNPGIEWWDGCSTGTHLHFQIGYSWYPSLVGWSQYQDRNSFDPRKVVNIPAKGVWFSNRYARY